MKKIFLLLTTLIFSFNFVFSEEVVQNESSQNEASEISKELPFNDKLSDEEKNTLQNGEVLIRNIKYSKHMSLNANYNHFASTLFNEISDLKPKYLAEIIQLKPYKGNEDLPIRLINLLNNVPEYAGIPYWSERHEQYYDLYESAEIKQINELEDGVTQILADLDMAPFGIVEEQIDIYQDNDSVLYTSVNLNKLRYYDEFDCVKPERMKMCILLIRDGDNWILYGIGGVNAPRIPFFTERIETSFMNRIKTFCDFIFKKF